MPVFFSPGPQTLRAGLSYVGSAVFANNRTTDSDLAQEQDDRSGSQRSYRVAYLTRGTFLRSTVCALQLT
jgi:hypothetical protein